MILPGNVRSGVAGGDGAAKGCEGFKEKGEWRSRRRRIEGREQVWWQFCKFCRGQGHF